MRRSLVSIGAVLVFAVGITASASAQAKDYAATALNIIPSGQYGALGNPAGFDTQAKMYDGLTPLFDQVTPADLTTYFKSERFGVDNATPSTVEAVPRAGVTIERDSYNVPHVTGPPTTTASGRPAGSPPRTAACCCSRRATTRWSLRSTLPGSAPSA